MTKKYLAIIFSAIIILIIWLKLKADEFNFSDEEVSKNPLIPVEINYWDINFAWEKMPTLGKYQDSKERFDKYFLVNSFSYYQVALYDKRTGKYFPFIEEKLKENWIPDDFKYLAVAESALKPEAWSPVWARGIWQFMPETAKENGLIVNKKIDERLNFEKATEASMKHLKRLHDLFGDWTLAAAAYNRGEGGLSSALTKQWVSNFYDLQITEETRDYIYRILWIKYSLISYEKSELKEKMWEKYTLENIKKVKIRKIDHIVEWCKKNGILVKDFYDLNPWILTNELPQWDWHISLYK